MKRWLITGASSGFGRLLTQRVATDGDHVIAVARREDRLRELAADHGSVTPLAVDLTAPDLEQRLGTAIDAASGLDILVNNAGYGLFSPVEQTPDSEARAVFNTNFFAPLAVLRAGLPSLRQNRGRVLQLSSMLGEVAWLGSGVYSASKAAIELAMEGLALELAQIGVKVTIASESPGGSSRVNARDQAVLVARCNCPMNLPTIAPIRALQQPDWLLSPSSLGEPRATHIPAVARRLGPVESRSDRRHPA
jgi:short-subunit dehydrogenase